MMRTPLLVIALALAAGCTKPPPGPNWMPLKPGLEQSYQVSLRSDVASPPEVWTIRTSGPHEWQGEQFMLREHSKGVSFYLKVDEKGIRRVAHKTEIDSEPVPDAQPQWVLKAPYQAGTQWSTATVPHLIQRINEYPRELKHSHKLKMNWQIKSVDESIALDNGKKYSACLHVAGEAVLKIYTDPVNGFQDVPIISHEWYCPDVGLVKFTRQEVVPAGFFRGGTLVAELIS